MSLFADKERERRSESECVPGQVMQVGRNLPLQIAPLTVGAHLQEPLLSFRFVFVHTERDDSLLAVEEADVRESGGATAINKSDD